MATSSRKTVPGKTVLTNSHSKTVPGKTIPGFSVVSGKKVPLISSSPSPSSTNSSSSTSLAFSNLSSDTTKSSNSNSKNSSPVRRQLLGLPNEDLSSYVGLSPCPHLSKVLKSSARDVVLKTYSTGMKICLMIPPDSENSNTNNNERVSYFTKTGKKVDQHELFKLRSKILKCKDCPTTTGLYMCLQCPNIGCLGKNHGYNHAKSSGHVFGICSSTGRLICFKCQDLVGHPLLERIRINSIKSSGMLSSYPGSLIYDHEHDLEKNKIIVTDSRLPTFKASTGLKGFINMGSTCFMSSILQTIVHNPLIRNYYFEGNHLDCPKSSEDCLACCVGDIFQDFYTSTSILGYGPTSLLTASWKVKKSLAGYSEQDAHEFWQFLIHQLHKNDTKSIKYTKNKESTPALENNKPSAIECDCITHRTFAGKLQSTLQCSECENIRITVDPMLDLSLEIQEKKKPLQSLDECLSKFTRPEILDVMYSCSACKKKTQVTKQLKIKKLPPVLSIQLKRFEHFGVSNKIDSHIDTPFMLDMSEYVLESEISKQCMNYELFGIICHIGSVNTGHYISFVKNKDGSWFKFDDAVVIRVNEAYIKTLRGYLLFYCVSELP